MLQYNSINVEDCHFVSRRFASWRIAELRAPSFVKIFWRFQLCEGIAIPIRRIASSYVSLPHGWSNWFIEDYIWRNWWVLFLEIPCITFCSGEPFCLCNAVVAEVKNVFHNQNANKLPVFSYRNSVPFLTYLTLDIFSLPLKVTALLCSFSNGIAIMQC